MKGDVDISRVARLLGDPSRAAMCQALLDGRFRTAGELGTCAGIARSTASDHLAALVDGGLLEAAAQGRHRYFRLAGPEVAQALEALAVIAPSKPVRSLREASAGRRLREGRTCYDHLAGRLGLAVTDALVASGVLTPSLALVDLTPLEPLHLPLDRAGRVAAARPCVDWTERRYHAAGTVPAALTVRLLELGWLERGAGDRAVRLTDAGDRGLTRLLGFRRPEGEAI